MYTFDFITLREASQKIKDKQTEKRTQGQTDIAPTIPNWPIRSSWWKWKVALRFKINGVDLLILSFLKINTSILNQYVNGLIKWWYEMFYSSVKGTRFLIKQERTGKIGEQRFVWGEMTGKLGEKMFSNSVNVTIWLRLT